MTNTKTQKAPPPAATGDGTNTTEANNAMPPAAPCHRQDQSATIGKLAFALAKAQGCMQAAKKGAENPFFKSRYADLSEVWATIRKPLADNQLAVIQTTVAEDGKLRLRTVLVHSSGEWVESVYPVNPQKQDPQGYGSAVTYARRYALSALVGVVADVDDDGEGAMVRPVNPSSPAAKKFYGLKDNLKNNLKQEQQEPPKLRLPAGKKKVVTAYLKKIGWIKTKLDELGPNQIDKINSNLDGLLKKAEVQSA